jgi:hypothetical protein
MENIKYKIKENENENKNNNLHSSTELFVKELIQNMHKECPDELIQDDKTKDDYILDNDSYIMQELDYQENFTVKMLGHILDYYKINKRKMKKIDMIDAIIMFENNEENAQLVEQRKLLWFYVNELREDTFFQKYILFDG